MNRQPQTPHAGEDFQPWEQEPSGSEDRAQHHAPPQKPAREKRGDHQTKSAEAESDLVVNRAKGEREHPDAEND